MTLVVGPNLSIDQTVGVPRLEVGTIHRVPQILKLAGGKGANLARALRLLGGEPLLIGFTGGPTGGQLAAYLAADHVASRLIPIAGETRICFSVADETTGAQTEFYEAGPTVRPEEVMALLDTAEQCIASACASGPAWVVLTGSLPRGVPPDLYARLIALAHCYGARVLLDAKGGPLAAGVAAGPDLLKINRSELEGLLGQALGAPRTVAEAAAGVVRLADGAAAIITLGAAGAVVVTRNGHWLIAPPGGRAILSPVGSGDALAAGVLAGLARGEGLPAAARLGVAAGTANALHLGAARFARSDVDALIDECLVSPLTFRASRPRP
jgi:1-phosphofructokinase family hexose kinase